MPLPFVGVSFPKDENHYVVPILRPSYESADVGRISLGTTPGVSTATTVVAGAIYRLSATTDVYYQFGGAGITATILGGSTYLPQGQVDPIYTVSGQTQLSFVSAVGSGGFAYWQRMY